MKQGFNFSFNLSFVVRAKGLLLEIFFLFKDEFRDHDVNQKNLVLFTTFIIILII